MACKIDDTSPLFCTIESAQSIGDHIEYRLKVQRGHTTEDCWVLSRRYSDFVALDSGLKPSGISPTLPPKKVFGNTSREFIAERQQKLQVYINEVLANRILANSQCTKQFLYDDSYHENFIELSLQHISMLLRCEPNWEVVEPLNSMGGRIRKSYFLVKNKQIQKERFILSWTFSGPYSNIEEKERITLIKTLQTIQHPYIAPVQYCAAINAGALFIRPYMEKGSILDQIYKTKPKTSYMKKYCNPKTFTRLTMPEIRKYCRQILETMKYMTDKGFPMGHVHLGNIFIEDGNIKLTDLENFLLGGSPKYRSLVVYHKKCNTIETLNSYAFGHMLFQLLFGRPLNTSSYENLPEGCPPELEALLAPLLTFDSLRGGIPSIEDLLEMPFFSEVQLPPIAKPVVKFPSKLKECLRNSKAEFEAGLREEQRAVSQIRKRNKAHAHHMTDEEKRKRKISQKKSVTRDDSGDGDTAKSSSVIGRNSASSSRPASRPTSTPNAPAAPAAPPPPPPPPGNPGPAAPAPAPPKSDSNRGALLDSIGSFTKGKLKKAVTVDKSGPKI